jgi:hypothetical protein
MVVSAAPKIVVSDLGKVFADGRGGERVILDHVSFEISGGAFICAIRLRQVDIAERARRAC